MFTSPEANVFEFGFMPGQSVADFGSGSGHYADVLSRTLGRDAKIYAVDINEEVLLRLKKYINDEGRENVEIIVGNVEKRLGSKLKSRTLDGVIMSNVLFQMEDRPQALIEARRVLHSGGRLCVLDWPDRLHKEGMKRVIESAGFEFLKEFDTQGYHYGMIFIKSNL